MKKILLIAFSFLLFTACSSDDDNTENWLNFSKPADLELTFENLKFFGKLPLVSATSDKDIDYNKTGSKSKDVFVQMTKSQKTKKLEFGGAEANPFVRIYENEEFIAFSGYEIKGKDLILSPFKKTRIIEDYTSVFKNVTLYGSLSTAGGINRGKGLILTYTEYSSFHNANITYTYKGDFN